MTRMSLRKPAAGVGFANPHVRLGVLLVCLAAAVLALLYTKGVLPGSDGGAQASGFAFSAGCPGRDAPEVARIPARDLPGLRDAALRVMPTRLGRQYEAGTIATSYMWTDDFPHPPTPRESTVPAAYDIRWWALDRDGAEDDVVADVLQFATEREAMDALARASSPRCRRGATARAAPFPAGATDLTWVNPDNARQWDVYFVRGRRLYWVSDAPPSYLPDEQQAGLARRHVVMTVDRLACALPDVGCRAGGGSLSRTSLANLAPVALSARRPVGRAQAAAYAHAVNLHAYDLPGAPEIAPEGPLRGGRRLWEAFARCTGELLSARSVATIHSRVFASGDRMEHELDYSTVALTGSETLARRYLAVIAGERARACITRIYNGRPRTPAARRRRLHVGPITVTPLPSRVPRSYRGTSPYNGVAARLTVPLRYRTRRGREVQRLLYLEEFTFAYGPAIVQLSATTLDHPLVKSEREYLMSALVGRAEANGYLLRRLL
jgi:hypothetical protein